jgi:hypothetical protein
VTVDPRTDIPDARVLRALWIGVLLPPAAFLINLEVAYALVPPACHSRSVVVVHLVHLICLGLAIFGGLVAARSWRQSGSTWPGDAGGPISRTRFMSGLGMLLGLQFTLVILAQWIPTFLLDPCQ